MKNKETIEEAAERLYPNTGFEDEAYCDLGEMSRELWLEGAKWYQERSYSPEEVIEIIKDYDNYQWNEESFNGKDRLSLKEWFVKFKNKDGK